MKRTEPGHNFSGPVYNSAPPPCFFLWEDFTITVKYKRAVRNSLQGALRDLRIIQFREVKAEGLPHCSLQLPVGEGGEGDAEHFLISRGRMFGNCSNLCWGRFSLDIRKNFKKRVAKHWNRFSREKLP